MSILKTQLSGGSFQDSEGNLLSGGYLTMRLNQDGVVNTSQVCAGIKITITLDGYGSVIAGQYVWANDVLLPTNSYYVVTAYTANGQIAWGNNNQQISSGGVGGGTFDVGTWTPNNVISWTPPLQPLALQTNETPNGLQTLLDLHAGSNITLTDNGSGRVTLAATVPGGLVLQTNETPNGSQALLDLHAGTNVTLTDNGSGRVTISSGTSAVTDPFLQYAGSGANEPALTPNSVFIAPFTLPYPLSFSNLAWVIGYPIILIITILVFMTYLEI